MGAINLVNGFLSYLLLMSITVGVAFAAGFCAIRLRKRNDVKKKEETEKEEN